MALNNFFKINLPYGIKRNDKGHWAAFNREYRPLGDNEFFKNPTTDVFIYTNYGKLSDRFLMQFADEPTAVQRDKNNVITRVFFYDDATNPANHVEDQPKLWDRYFKKIELLSKQKVYFFY